MGCIVGHRQTVLEISLYNHTEQQWYHLTRVIRDALHSTKGWRKASADQKTLRKIPAVDAVISIRATQQFEWTGGRRRRGFAP